MHVAIADMQMTLWSLIWCPIIFPPLFFLFSMISGQIEISLSPAVWSIDVHQLVSGADPKHKWARCDAHSSSAMGHSRPMHSVPVPINVRCYSNSDIYCWRSEVTLRAICGHSGETINLLAWSDRRTGYLP